MRTFAEKPVLAGVLLCAATLQVFALGGPRAFVVTNGATRYIVTEFPLVEVKKHAGMPEVRAVEPGDAGVRPFAAIVSPDAKRTMYWWTTEDPRLERMHERTGSGRVRISGHMKGKVVVDGKESPTYLHVYDTTAAWIFAPLWPGTFSPDSKRYAYVAYPEKNRRITGINDGVGTPHGVTRVKLVVDGEESRRYYGEMEGRAFFYSRGPGQNAVAPMFSPDSKRTACVVAWHFDDWAVLVDGKEHPRHYRVGPPVFSPDSRHIAYWALGKKTLHYTMVIDHVPTKEYAFPISDGIYGKAGSMPEGFCHPRPMLKWDGPYKALGAVITGNEICRIEVTIVENTKRVEQQAPTRTPNP